MVSTIPYCVVFTVNLLTNYLTSCLYNLNAYGTITQQILSTTNLQTYFYLMLITVRCNQCLFKTHLLYYMT